jgi:hypothetical protein
MEAMKPRIILHLDMDSFFAFVEMQAHRELRNEPAIIPFVKLLHAFPHQRRETPKETQQAV